MNVTPGSLVRYREREWVVLPSEDAHLLLLRPIGGSGREVCGVLKPLAEQMAYSLPFERITSAQFPLPDPTAVQDHVAVRLTLEAARLLLREGAAPFRSLGHLSIRPRPYQFVPLLMALRLQTIRLLLADDVGVGKTIEAALIARELLDRGEVRRLAVFCPPYLCDQWQKELAEKFHLEAVVIRSGTVSRLERQKPPDRSLFQHYRHFVASIDLVKSERYRPAFLQYCPELVLVDEVHGAAQPPGERRDRGQPRLARGQQQRHDLLKELAANPNRHLILLSATPHSGVEDSFLSILGLLKPEFRQLNLSQMTEAQRDELARYFIQRRRADIKKWLGQETHFPERDDTDAEQPYQFSREYREFYQSVYDFARNLVRSAETLTGWKKRMRFWSALALLRCVTSSPAAAETALLKRANGDAEPSLATRPTTEEELDAAFEPVIYDPLDAEAVVDAPPGSVFDAQEQDPDWQDTDRRRLRQFARMARQLRGEADTKLQKLVTVVNNLLRDNYHPIIWCRYIATSEYVAEELQRRLEPHFPNLRVVSITGALTEDERRLKVEELTQSPRRVLVATDCLSEGINLQEHFTAVVHYDLPWNPNRLEQREGRVDRFGQTAAKVKAVLIFGQDNPVDGAVLDVLLRKARDIHRDLGIHVPIPMDSETVMEAVLRSLFTRARYDQAQLHLFDESDEARRMMKLVHERWGQAAEREKQSRSRFAQRAIRPEELEQELKETDMVLGDPEAVRCFLQEVSQRLSFGFRPLRQGKWELHTANLPPTVRQRLGQPRFARGPVPEFWPITFDSPTPEGVTYVGRNHPLVEALAEYLLDLAFHPTQGKSPVSRCGVIRTDQVKRRTTLLLLRLRYLLYEHNDSTPRLAEETLVWGFEGLPHSPSVPTGGSEAIMKHRARLPEITFLSPETARHKLDTARPSANVSASEKRQVLVETLEWWNFLQSPAPNGSGQAPSKSGQAPSKSGQAPSESGQVNQLLADRARHLQESHQRVRRLLRHEGVRIEPQTPPDLLGILVLLPIPQGAGRCPEQ